MATEREIEFLYHYVVGGHTMEEIADHFGTTTTEVSEIVRGYGFNKNKRGGWQRGEDCGRYRPGARTSMGVTVTRDMLWDYTDNIDYWEYDFHDYVASIAADERDRRQAEQAQRDAELQRQREAQERAAAYARAIAEQNAARERDRKNASDSLSRARSLLAQGKLQQAYNEANKAHRLNRTPESTILIAEILVRDGIEAHADVIIDALTSYFSHLSNNNVSPTVEQYLWLARAYAASGDKQHAFENYFFAGDAAYAMNDFKQADAIYGECLDRTHFYLTGSEFNMAYARSSSRDKLTADDHRYCAEYYKKYLSHNSGSASAHGNLVWHLYVLKDYRGAAEHGRIAAQSGKTYFLSRLADACCEIGDYEGAVRYYRAAEDAGMEIDEFRLAVALKEEGEDDDAKELFESLVYTHYDEEEVYVNLLEIAESNYDDEEIAKYRLELIKLDSTEALFNEREWYDHAVEHGYDDIAEEMLEHLDDLRREVKGESIKESLEELERLIDYDADENEVAENADEIIETLEKYVEYAREENESVSREQYLLLARAYAANTMRVSAAEYYFRAGGDAYDMGDYGSADAIYSEALAKGCSTSDAHFRIAYARSASRGTLTEDDHRFCIEHYREHLTRYSSDVATRNNLMHHHINLGEYSEAVTVGLPAANSGNANDTTYNNLAVAYRLLENRDEAKKWYGKLLNSGGKYAERAREAIDSIDRAIEAEERAEAERIAAEYAESLRIEAERKAEEERIEAERIAAEKKRKAEEELLLLL